MARSGLRQSPETGRRLGCEGLWGLVDAGEDAFQGLLHAFFSLKGNLGMETGSVSRERPCCSQPSLLLRRCGRAAGRNRLQPPVCHLQGMTAGVSAEGVAEKWEENPQGGG